MTYQFVNQFNPSKDEISNAILISVYGPKNCLKNFKLERASHLNFGYENSRKCISRIINTLLRNLRFSIKHLRIYAKNVMIFYE